MLYHIDKTQVFQEARMFNQSPIQPRKCRILLTKIIFVLDSGDSFSTREATELFFGVTKLFQHKDVRRDFSRENIVDK
jgi:coatomer protein complex subunit gamma